MNKNIFGLISAIVVGVAAFYLSKSYPLFDSLVLGLLLGILTRLFFDIFHFPISGTESVSRFLVFTGLVLYGVNLKLDKLAEISVVTWLQVIVGIIVVFWLAIIAGKRLKICAKGSVLTAVGTAICGASAIIMSAFVIKAEKKDIGRALLAITVWGLMGVVLYPYIQKLLAMSADSYAVFTATTLSQTGFVKMAALYLGKSVESAALSIKVIRTALIIPILFILAIWFKEEKTALPAVNGNGEKESSFKWLYLALAGFVLAGISFSFLPVLFPYAKTITSLGIGVILWTIAMASIGLGIEIKSFLAGFSRFLVLGLLLWLALIVVFMFGYWAVL